MVKVELTKADLSHILCGLHSEHAKEEMSLGRLTAAIYNNPRDKEHLLKWQKSCMKAKKEILIIISKLENKE